MECDVTRDSTFRSKKYRDDECAEYSRVVTCEPSPPKRATTYNKTERPGRRYDLKRVNSIGDKYLQEKLYNTEKPVFSGVVYPDSSNKMKKFKNACKRIIDRMKA